MNKFSSIFRILCPLLIAASCSSDDPPGPSEDDFEGIEEAADALTNLTAQCVWTPVATTSPAVAAGTMTLSLKDGDVAVVSKLSNGNIGVNGFPCTTSPATTAVATATALKKLVVNQDALAAALAPKTVILDYLAGPFGAGTAAGVGTEVDLGTGGGALKIRGTKTADNFEFGVAGISINIDKFRDINYTNVGTFVVTLSVGDDFFSGAGSKDLTGPATGSTAFTFPITVYGGDGNDTLRGGDGDDVLNGGPGNDTFNAGPTADGADTMIGGGAVVTPPGYDTADYHLRTVNLVLSNVAVEDPTTHVITYSKSGADSNMTTPGPASEGDIISPDIHVIMGGAGDDLITSSTAGGNILWGNGGNDTFVQTATISVGDVFNGGDGNDTVSYAARTVAVLVTIDATALDGETGEKDKVNTDVENVTGGAGDDTLTGSADNNILSGGAGFDKLSGGAGNDTLIGGADDDILRGEAGDDTFVEDAAPNGADTMIGGAGVDTVDYSARILPLYIKMDAVTKATTPFLMGTASGGGTMGSEGDLIGTDVENCIGGHEADTIIGNAADNQLEGGSDTLTLTSKIDTIDGGAGDDVIDGGPGLDVVTCGDGDDFLLDLGATNTLMDCEI